MAAYPPGVEWHGRYDRGSASSTTRYIGPYSSQPGHTLSAYLYRAQQALQLPVFTRVVMRFQSALQTVCLRPRDSNGAHRPYPCEQAPNVHSLCMAVVESLLVAGYVAIDRENLTVVPLDAYYVHDLLRKREVRPGKDERVFATSTHALVVNTTEYERADDSSFESSVRLYVWRTAPITGQPEPPLAPAFQLASTLKNLLNRLDFLSRQVPTTKLVLTHPTAGEQLSESKAAAAARFYQQQHGAGAALAQELHAPGNNGIVPPDPGDPLAQATAAVAAAGAAPPAPVPAPLAADIAAAQMAAEEEERNRKEEEARRLIKADDERRNLQRQQLIRGVTLAGQQAVRVTVFDPADQAAARDFDEAPDGRVQVLPIPTMLQADQVMVIHTSASNVMQTAPSGADQNAQTSIERYNAMVTQSLGLPDSEADDGHSAVVRALGEYVNAILGSLVVIDVDGVPHVPHVVLLQSRRADRPAKRRRLNPGPRTPP